MELFFLSPGYVNLLLFYVFFFSFHIKGLHAAPLIRKRVYTSGIPEESPEKGSGEEDAVPWLHHVGMVGWLIYWFLTDWINILMSNAMHVTQHANCEDTTVLFPNFADSICVSVSFSSAFLIIYLTHLFKYCSLIYIFNCVSGQIHSWALWEKFMSK